MAEKAKYQKQQHFCPFCDAEIAEASFPYCEACQVNKLACPECHEPVARNVQVCPKCGADIRKKSTGRGKK
jgi:RNA polymerase subunit RPABC4/transcription elongation factor Spt4